MGIFLVFIFKSTLCLTLFYLFYRLLLSRDTFHRFNRMALLGVAAFSIAIPFIQLEVSASAIGQHPVQNLDYLLQMAQVQAEAELEPLGLSLFVMSLFALYIFGCLFFMVRFLYSAYLILRLIRSGHKTKQEGGIRLIVTPQPVSPFSWMKYVVISQSDLEESGREIIMHEKAHAQSGHSFDMLLIGLCSILHWFNPAVWLLKQELQNVHEYEADESVIAHGVDAKRYQLLLIKKAVGSQRFTSMANSFNHSTLKKRIAMMLKQKSNPCARLKYLYVLPLAAITVTVFARPEISRELETISAVNVIEPSVIPSIIEAKPPVVTINKQNPPVAQSDSIVVVGYGTMQNASRSDKETVINVDQIKEKLLIIVDGQKIDSGEMDKLPPEKIKSITVLKDKESIKQYEPEAKEGVILITTYDIDKPAAELKSVPQTNFVLPNGTSSSLKDPLVIVDGKEVPYDEMEKIDPTQIESVSVLKSEKAAELYGEKGKTKGVIVITLKK